MDTIMTSDLRRFPYLHEILRETARPYRAVDDRAPRAPRPRK